MKIELRILNKEFYSNNDLPSYATPGSAALDLTCTKDITLRPQERTMIKTGLAIWLGTPQIYDLEAFPTAHEIFTKALGFGLAGVILPRSGLGTNGLVLANTVGLIDEDYQGELMVSAWNSNKPTLQSLGYRGVDYFTDYEERVIQLKAGDRFAQIYFQPVVKVQLAVVEEFSQKTDRGDGGFGHSGA